MRYLIAAVLFVLLFNMGCVEKVRIVPEKPVDLTKVDLTGYWNGYRYFDFNGLVPLEIIKVVRIDSNYHVATKILGDLAVPTGYVTWEGAYTGNPFNVLINTGDGNSTSFVSSSLKVVNENLLEEQNLKVYFVRRVDKNLE